MHRSVLSLCLLGAASSAWAENTASTTLSVYTDDDATDVITSVTRAKAEAWEGGTVEASYLIDVISSASVDVVTQATPGFQEHRHSVNAGVSQEVKGYTVRGSYGYSVENDYWGHGVAVGAGTELFQKNTTVDFDYALELGTIGRANDEVFRESLTTHNVDVSVSQVLSKRAVGQFGYSLQGQRGYTAKPYRFARVGRLGAGICRVCPPETHPDSRTRNVFFGAGKYHLFGESAAELRYRYYIDSWSLQGHTVEGLVHLGWSKNLGARVRYRVHIQNAASFYEDRYTTVRQYMTSDRELSPLTGHLTGLKVFGRLEDFWFFKRAELNAKIDVFQYDYDDFERLPRRRGFVVESGLGVTF